MYSVKQRMFICNTFARCVSQVITHRMFSKKVFHINSNVQNSGKILSERFSVEQKKMKSRVFLGCGKVGIK